jgi:hypothetical protein
MALWDFGNPPINSTGFAPIAAGSTTALFAEVDSTQLGTKDFLANQKMLVQVTWIVGADTNVTWQLETANSTALNAGQDVLYVKNVTGQSAQFVTRHQLFKDYRVRARQFSSGANGAAFISVEPLS